MLGTVLASHAVKCVRRLYHARIHWILRRAPTYGAASAGSPSSIPARSLLPRPEVVINCSDLA
jgi:hypothetical protein